VSGPEAATPSSNRLSVWRVGAAAAVLAVLASIGALLVPVYFRNFQLEKFLHETQPASDDALKQTILAKGRAMGLDLPPDHLQIRPAATGGPTQVRYVVRVNLPLYTVDLHFSSNISAGVK
jgi:hypothetical protein